MKIKANASTRLDLAGGTIDIWPIWAIIGEVKTINLATDLPTEVTVSTESKNRKMSNNSKLIDLILNYYELNYKQTFPFNIEIMSHYPKRAGLAGSSSLVISIISCLDTYLGVSRSYTEIINLASNLEAAFLRCPTGTQDYYPILWGGINVIHYRPDGVKHEIIPAQGEIFKSLYDSILLIKAEGYHDSGNLNWTLMRDFIDGKENTIQQINLIAEAANLVYDALKNDDIVNFYKGINLDMHARVSLGNNIVPEVLRTLANEMIEQGIFGAKICGAGGNACLALFCGSDKKCQITSLLESKGYQVVKTPIRLKGVEISKSND